MDRWSAAERRHPDGGVLLRRHRPLAGGTDRRGRYANVSLGLRTLEEYVASSPYFGALIGRYGNRIGKGTFTLDGTRYQLSVNDGDNSLHGGAQGFDKRVWDVEPFTRGSDVGLRLYYTAVDGEMGYPGTLRTKVTYTLTRDGDWRVDYEAVTDRPTVVNLTSHVYWNWPTKAAEASWTTSCRSPPPATPPSTRA
ncbi:Aldose 1-epimerase [Streptomyces griseoloalbus]